MKSKKKEDVLLSWSKLTQISEGQDPLGLNLRVSARLSSQLLYCITSITPRARYYSFLPWCISEYIEREKGKVSAGSLKDAIISREGIFALGCLAWHGGNPCDDGRLVGSRTLSPFYERNRDKRVNKKDVKYVDQPAIDAYNASIAGLELFKIETDQTQGLDDEKVQLSFDDIELSDLGKKVAESYGKSIENLPIIKSLASRKTFHIGEISQWGRYGGLCELREGSPPDRKILTDLFLNNVKLKSKSHEFRRNTLALILKTAEKLAKEQVALNENSFNDAVYFDSIKRPDGTIKKIIWPSTLKDIATRWRMFHFHFYLSYALESILVNLVNKALSAGIEGFTFDEFITDLNSRSVIQSIGQILQIEFKKNFFEMTPREIFALSGIEIRSGNAVESNKIDRELGINQLFSERNLHDLISDKSLFRTSEGTILALMLLIIVTLRYIKWENTPQGNWLFQAVDDPYKDITVPIILRELRGHVGDYWNAPWKVLAPLLINRFVIRQHELLALDKSWDGSRAFFHTDQDVIRKREASYGQPTCHNTRFASTILILKDLNLLKTDRENEEILQVTPDATKILRKDFSH